jgi:hypothetical protein
MNIENTEKLLVLPVSFKDMKEITEENSMNVNKCGKASEYMKEHTVKKNRIYCILSYVLSGRCPGAVSLDYMVVLALVF